MSQGAIPMRTGGTHGVDLEAPVSIEMSTFLSFFVGVLAFFS